MKTTCYWISHQ